MSPRAMMVLAMLAASGCTCDVPIGLSPDGSVRRDGGSSTQASLDECGNGMDDDGDGRIDEDCFCAPSQTQRCYAGPVDTVGVGLCTRGTQRCAVEGSVEWGRWGECDGDVLPSPEACDGRLDEDCDGAVDEGCPCAEGAMAPCDVPEFVSPPCRAGTQACRAGAWTACEGAIRPTPEVCGNGIDEDCDGEVDDARLCRCSRPEPELCGDALDNDCDGAVDEDCIACVPRTEECGNATDDDCDARVDEGVPEVCGDGVDQDCSGADLPCAMPDGGVPACGAPQPVTCSSSLLETAWSPDGVIVAGDSPRARFVEPRMIDDGCGGAILVYSTRDPATVADDRGIYIQRVRPDGVPLWGPNGVELTSGAVVRGVMVAGGAGSAFVAWRESGGTTLRLQHVAADGVPTIPAGGVSIPVVDAVALGATEGDAIVAYWHSASELRAQRFTAGGAAVWPRPTTLCRGGSCSAGQSSGVFDAPSGRLFVARIDGSERLVVHAVAADGSVPWATAPTFAPEPRPFFPSVVPDGAGGAYVTWTRFVGGPGNRDPMVQRVFADGALAWGAGVAVNVDGRDQWLPRLVVTASGHPLVVWEDGRDDASSGPGWLFDLYAQRLDPSSGALAWGADGLAVADLAGIEEARSVLPDACGGAIVLYSHMTSASMWRGAPADVRINRISSTGSMAIPGAGLALAVSPTGEGLFVSSMVHNGPRAVIAAWAEDLSGSTGDSAGRIRVQRVVHCGCP